MSEWLIALIASGALAVMLTWAFQWGRRGGGVNARLDDLERRANDPQILPQCAEIFTEIKEKLASLDGSVGVMLGIMKENQKNDEKKHITSKEQKK